MIYFEYNETSDHNKEKKQYHMQNGDFMLS